MYHNYFKCSWDGLLEGRNCSWSGRSGAQSSVASTKNSNSSKRESAGCEGSRVIFPALLLTLDEYRSWRVGIVVPMIHSAVRITLLSLLRSDLVAGLNQTVIDVQKTDSIMAEYNCFSSSCGRLNFLSWRRKYSLCWAFLFYNGVYVIVPRTSGPGRWMVSGGEQRGENRELFSTGRRAVRR